MHVGCIDDCNGVELRSAMGNKIDSLGKLPQCAACATLALRQITLGGTVHELVALPTVKPS